MYKFMVVEDDPEIAAIVREGLRELGGEVDIESNGRRGLEKALANSYDIIILDMMIPEMDGFTLTRHIKQDARFKSIPVVIHSSLTGTTNEAHVSAVGADAFVAKFEASELAAALRKVIRH